jgi:hypothetical protein
MFKHVVNCETGEIEIVEMTQEEIAALLAQQTQQGD